VPGAGGEVDRAEQAAALVAAGGGHQVAGTARDPAGSHLGQQVQMGFVLGQHDRSGWQRGDTLPDGGHDGVVVGVGLGGQAGASPGCLFADAAVHRVQADRWSSQFPPDSCGGPGFRPGQQGADAFAQARAAQPGTSGPGPVGQPVDALGVPPGDPATHRVRVVVQQFRDLGGTEPLAGQQDHHQPHRHPPAAVQGFEQVTVLARGYLGIQVNRAHTDIASSGTHMAVGKLHAIPGEVLASVSASPRRVTSTGYEHNFRQPA
jgi:hypothetical protein